MCPRTTVQAPKWVAGATPGEVLAVARARERGASRQYAAMARCAQDRVLRAKLRYLAAEEADHAKRVADMAKGLARPGRGFRPPDGVSEVPPDAAEEDLIATLRWALQAERASRALYLAAADWSAASARQVFQQLAQSEGRHEEMLRLELAALEGRPVWSSLEGRVWAEEDFW